MEPSTLGPQQKDRLSKKVTSLDVIDVIFDKHMTISDEEIDRSFRSSIRHVRNIFRIRRYLDENSASKVMHAIKTSRLDYCDHMYFGMPKQRLISAHHC